MAPMYVYIIRLPHLCMWRICFITHASHRSFLARIRYLFLFLPWRKTNINTHASTNMKKRLINCICKSKRKKSKWKNGETHKDRIYFTFENHFFSPLYNPPPLYFTDAWTKLLLNGNSFFFRFIISLKQFAALWNLFSCFTVVWNNLSLHGHIFLFHSELLYNQESTYNNHLLVIIVH